MRIAACIVVAIAVLFIVGVSSAGATWTFNDGGVHTVDYVIPDEVVVSNNTTLRIVVGGHVNPPNNGGTSGKVGIALASGTVQVAGGRVEAGDGNTGGGKAIETGSGRIEVSGGEVTGGNGGTTGGAAIDVDAGGVVVISGGVVTGGDGGTVGARAIYMWNGTFMMSGGEVHSGVGQGDAILLRRDSSIAGGLVDGQITATDLQLVITGGSFTRRGPALPVITGTNALVQIHGGTFQSQFRIRLYGVSIAEVYGRHLTIAGPVPGFAHVSGELEDGEQFEQDFQVYDTSAIVLIEPVAIAQRTWGSIKGAYRD